MGLWRSAQSLSNFDNGGKMAANVPGLRTTPAAPTNLLWRSGLCTQPRAPRTVVTTFLCNIAPSRVVGLKKVSLCSAATGRPWGGHPTSRWGLCYRPRLITMLLILAKETIWKSERGPDYCNGLNNKHDAVVAGWGCWCWDTALYEAGDVLLIFILWLCLTPVLCGRFKLLAFV